MVSVSFAVRREDEQKNDVRARERELARVAKSMPNTSGAGSPDNYPQTCSEFVTGGEKPI